MPRLSLSKHDALENTGSLCPGRKTSFCMHPDNALRSSTVLYSTVCTVVGLFFFSSPNFLITSLSPHSLVFRPEFNHQTWQFAPVDTTCARAGALTFTVLWTEDTEEVTSGYLALGWRSKLGQREKKAKKGQNWKFYNLSHMKWPIYSKIMWVCS